MKKWLFFNRINTFCNRFSIHQAIENTFSILPYAANAFFAILDTAAVMTEEAVSLPVFCPPVAHSLSHIMYPLI